MTTHGFNVIETSLPPDGTLNEYRRTRPTAERGPLAAIAATSRAVLAAHHFRAHGHMPAWARTTPDPTN